MIEERSKTVRTFRDLEVWQMSIELTVVDYMMTQGFPGKESLVLSAQLRHSAVSIPSNIAEGQGWFKTGEFRQFPGVARGSNCERELQTQLDICPSSWRRRPECDRTSRRVFASERQNALQAFVNLKGQDRLTSVNGSPLTVHRSPSTVHRPRKDQEQ
ncbi:MAG TPA: four helix bundle protein [Terracidiphilus sp.]|nr:four helix bundle protein [Terracidiphilus sp.]